MGYKILNKEMNVSLPDLIVISEKSRNSLVKLNSFFIAIKNNYIQEWRKIPLYNARIDIKTSEILSLQNTELIQFYNLPELIFTSEGYSVERQIRTYNYVYKMKPPYEEDLLIQIICGMQIILYQKINLPIENMKYFNEEYKRLNSKIPKL